MNNYLIFAEAITTFALLLLIKRIFGKYGLIMWIPIAIVVANITTAKNANIFGFDTAIGTVMFASTFLATDILNECYDKKDAKRGVWLGLAAIIIFIVSTQFALLYQPSEIDFANESMAILFSLNLRISVASAVMYLIANMADIYLFEKIRKLTKGKYMWLRNNVATIVCNCLENFLFMFLAWIGIYSLNEILIIAVSTSIIEVVVGLLDTPFLYLAKGFKDLEIT